ncbi:poly [ADP-ribose] polymerase 12 isoform X1 [Poecilia latipinna]|uniref:poly [ADP-ribose] polymerase 12 isoform X1 n=1 Tax=Poecilia latipinna TaxID=48699 RepID=UPI00072EA3E5|nr:PREDICTED: poly [ADP-ribose] polymerase 12-like isoform X1 [Poecilia latipinna]
MEAEILKFICANQGAADAEELMYNLFPGESTTEVISNQSKFALCSSNGQQRVVARTSLRLCRKKGCPGTCEGLHMCKNFLFSGSCHFLQRKGCSFPHVLNSDYNQRLLIEHELEGLSRAELCTLLLQSDNSMLPAICHDYNNGDGVFGRCTSGVDCERLHICQKYLTQSCSCSRAHDFTAFQPKKVLHDKMVPDDMLRSLKSVYANREALRYYDRGGAGRGHRGNDGSNHGPNSGRRPGNRGRGGNRGNRGPRGRGMRGSRGNRGNSRQQETATHSDLVGDLDWWATVTGQGCFETKSEQGDFWSSSSDVSGAGCDFDSRSDCGLSTEQRQWNRGRGRGRTIYRGFRGTRGSRGGRGNAGNDITQLRSTSFGDIWGEFSGLNLCSQSKSPPPSFNSSNSDVSAAADDSEASSNMRKKRSRSRNRTSANKGRGGNQPGLRRTSAVDEMIGAAGGQEGNGADDQKGRQKNKPVKDKTEICMYFIKGYCKHDDKCFKAHDKMPYRWQVQEGGQWNALPDNEAIEKEYCDPSNTYSSGSPPVHFDTMTRGGNKVRRLTTVNSLVEPTFIHTTEWLWYWQDEFGKWNLYGSDNAGRKSSDIRSETLEQKFLDNESEVEFSAGSQSYSLSFQDMIQTNRHYGTKRLVSRRPLFVSAADVRTKKVRRPAGSSSPVPDHWDKTQIPPTGFSRVAVPLTSDEFQKLEALFRTTLRGFDIIKIERIQNKALWEVFQWQKTQMKNNNRGREVEEKQLFHGTDSKHIDAICLNNFDWRICGVNGTAYGKGSYFARDAKYSHSYTGDSDVKTMFVSRVLVGSYTRGDSSYVRPPSKDGGDINFYDSCVNDIANPSIFVVFEKHQIYPEYLLSYKTTHPLVDRLSSTSAQQPKPVIAPKPPVYQPNTASKQTISSSHQYGAASYLTSSSLYPSTMASNQTISSSYQPTTVSKQTSSSSYQPTTASNQTISSSYQPSATLTRSSSYQPSTTSSLYQTRYDSQRTLSSPPSPSKPTKKNDSCVIA